MFTLSFRWTLIKWFIGTIQELSIPLGKRMLEQAAKTSSVLDYGYLDLGEEGVDRQLQSGKEETKPGPCKVISKKGVVVLGQEEHEFNLTSVADGCYWNWIPCVSCSCSHMQLPLKKGSKVKELRVAPPIAALLLHFQSCYSLTHIKCCLVSLHCSLWFFSWRPKTSYLIMK